MSATEWKPATPLELSRFIEENFQGPRRPLLPVGGRTALHWGGNVPTDSVVVQTAGLDRIVDYPARDMTITVEAGLRLEELHAALKAESQRLPVDVPLARRATIGGAIASNTSGPGRFGYGTFRDYVIGISGVDGQGRLFSAGGRVVKNVAGYDLCKLLTGSQGTLAVITQVTLKLKPTVELRQLVVISTASCQTLDSILDRVNTSATRPVLLDVLNPKAARQVSQESRLDLPLDQSLLVMGYEGNQADVIWQVQMIQQELAPISVSGLQVLAGEQADQLWSGLAEYQAASDDPVTVQISLLPSQGMQVLEECSQWGLAVQVHAGNGILIGHLPDRCSDATAAGELLGRLKSLVDKHAGTMLLLNGEVDWKPELLRHFSPLPATGLHVRMKQAFDPAHLLSPGRFWSLSGAEAATAVS